MSDTRKCDICGVTENFKIPMHRFFHKTYLTKEADVIDICDFCMKVIARESKKVRQ